MAWAGSDAMIQSAALWGVWGLSLVTVYAAAAPALLVGGGQQLRLSRFAPAWIAALLLGLLWAWGLARLDGAGDGAGAGVRLRLVQPDIPQTLKWQPGMGEQHIAKAVRLSLAPGFERVTAVIWPETTVPFALDRNPWLGPALARAAPEGGLLLTGIPRVTPPGVTPVEFWNSMVALDRSGVVRGTYDKFHLVPLGEYVPIRGIPGVSRLAPSESDFSAGPGPRTLDLPGLPPVSPLICYEVIFPGEVVESRHRPAWLLNLTNDAWFGLSAGPYQHFASARMRAVEEGLPLVRAANNGISGVVDGYGRVIARLGLGEEGVLDVSLPAALPPTAYARFGDAVAFALALALSLASVIARRVG
jgi:apolipoprotein N-acyltransferase